MVIGAQKSFPKEGTSKRTLKEEQAPAMDRQKRREGKEGGEMKKERFETLKTACAQVQSKEIEAKD